MKNWNLNTKVCKKHSAIMPKEAEGCVWCYSDMGDLKAVAFLEKRFGEYDRLHEKPQFIRKVPRRGLVTTFQNETR